MDDTAEIQERDVDGVLMRQYSVYNGKKQLVGATKAALVSLVMTDTGSGARAGSC